MPSHILTRLGLWQDSIASNMAASKAARNQGDTGEERPAARGNVFDPSYGANDLPKTPKGPSQDEPFERKAKLMVEAEQS